MYICICTTIGVGDAFILRYNKPMVDESASGGAYAYGYGDHTAPSSNFGFDSNHGRFMSSFIRDMCPLGIVVENSFEVKVWLDKFKNPYY